MTIFKVYNSSFPTTNGQNADVLSSGWQQNYFIQHPSWVILSVIVYLSRSIIDLPSQLPSQMGVYISHLATKTQLISLVSMIMRGFRVYLQIFLANSGLNVDVFGSGWLYNHFIQYFLWTHSVHYCLPAKMHHWFVLRDAILDQREKIPLNNKHLIEILGLHNQDGVHNVSFIIPIHW